MRLEIKKYLEDIRQAVDKIINFSDGKSFQDYKADDLLRAGIERQFEIIGEAMNRVGKNDSSVLAKISKHERIISFRNILIHGYDIVNDNVVWDIIQKDLPILLNEITALLEE